VRIWLCALQKLLIDELSPGVAVLNSTFGVVVAPAPAPAPGPAPAPAPLPDRNFCGSVHDPSYLLTLSCNEQNATISDIIFADYGLPTGGCTAPKKDPNCSSVELDMVVTTNCTGKQRCTINTFWPGITPHIDPCFGKVKTLRVVARCSSGNGKASNNTGSPSTSPPVYMQGYRSQTEVGAGAGHKLLMVNRRATAYDLKFEREEYAADSSRYSQKYSIRSLAGGLVRVVDQASGEGWYRNETVGVDGVLRLAPFAVGVLHLPS
jgi:hypothetical protein